MGQRSQIYVRYNIEDGKKGLIANYYGWNFGERMISRARWGIEHVLDTLKYGWYYKRKDNVTKLSRIFDTNFDMRDIQISCDIIKEHAEDFQEESFNDYVFLMQDNNDGKLVIDILGDVVKYAFLDRDANADHIMDGESYMCWNNGEKWRESEHLTAEDIKTCEENIKFITEHATLMTKEDVEEFINHDYSDVFPEQYQKKTIITVEDLKLKEGYEFECNMSKEYASYHSHDEWGCAYARLGDIGVEYNFCIDGSSDEEFNCSAIYKMEKNGSTGNMETDSSTFMHHEVDFSNPNWEEKLEDALCFALIKFHNLQPHAS